MAATHKWSGSTISITSSLPADRLAEISKTVGEATKGNAMIGLNHVRFEGAATGRTNFSIRAMADKIEFMTFHVTIADAPNGSTAASRIDRFKTKQQKLLMLIPLGPKTIMAYKTYRLFMTNLQSAVTAADPASRIVVTEQAGR
jgi:hypothetical protein